MFYIMLVCLSCSSKTKELSGRDTCNRNEIISRADERRKHKKKPFEALEKCTADVLVTRDTCESLVYFVLFVQNGSKIVEQSIFDSIEKVLYLGDTLADFNNDSRVDFLVFGETNNGRQTHQFARYFEFDSCVSLKEFIPISSIHNPIFLPEKKHIIGRDVEGRDSIYYIYKWLSRDSIRLVDSLRVPNAVARVD